MTPRRSRVVPLILAATVLGSATACAADRDPLQVGTPSPAAPAVAPETTTVPAGTVWRVGANATAVAIDPVTRRIAVGVESPPRLLMLASDTGSTEVTVPLTAPVTDVVALPGGGFRAVAGTTLVSVQGAAAPITSRLPAVATAVTPLADGTAAVALPDRGEVAVVGADGAVRRTIAVEERPDAVTATSEYLGVVDATNTSLTSYDLKTGKRAESLRAGNGAVTVVTDRNDRFVVVDTRDGELMVFTTGPLYMRQRAPVAGTPYGAAYDPRRHLLWVTLTSRNEVVAYDLSGAQPAEVARHPTARQPDGVAVDPTTGVVAVTGKADGVVQVISR